MKYVPPLGAADPNASYHDGNPEAGILGSIVPAAAIERPQREILSVLAAAGIVPSDTDNAQLAAAISALILAQKIKLTDRVNLTDSATAASATAVKAAYDAAESKLSLSGGTVTGSLSIRNILDLIGTAPATEQELGLYLLDKNSNIMGGHDFVHSVGNLKITQMYARNSSGLISSLGVYASEDGTRYTLSSHNIILTGDVEIGRMHADGVRFITFSGAGDSPGRMMRYSPDSGELYLDGRAVHGKADTAGYADTAGSANTLGGKSESALSVNYANSAGSAGNAGTLGGKAESALSVAFASEAQNAYALKGVELIIFDYPNTQTLPGYGTWMIYYTTVVPGSIYNQFPAIVAGGTVLSLDREGSMARGIAIRTA